MKKHQFYFEFLSQTCLLGISISQFEIQEDDNGPWKDTFRIEVGLIFFIFSYTKISI